MSYYPPYGQGPPPAGGGYYQQTPPPPPQGYHQPPPGQYPPPQQGGGYPPQYGAPPPQHAPYGAPPPPGGPYQYNQPAPGYGQPPPPGPPYGQPPYGQPGGPPPPHAGVGGGGGGGGGYGQPPYGAPPPGGAYGGGGGGYAANVPPTPPSPGYGAPQVIAWDPTADANALRQAMKGFGTDETTLIRVLATKDPLQIETLRSAYHRQHRRDLVRDIESETSHWLEYGLVALCRGPLLNDVHMLHAALSGPGTKEDVLNDVLLGRSNADLQAIKAAYQQTYRRPLVDAVRGDLSMKTERHFVLVLQGTRDEDAAPVVKSAVDQDVQALYTATEGRMGTDEIRVCSILTTRNDNHLRAVAYAYQQQYARTLEDVIRREFSGHMESALLYQLRHATDKYMHQASLLEDAMVGAGTRDQLLIARVVRMHWDRSNMANVRGAYETRYRKNLAQRIRGETSGDYERMLLACLGEKV
ncbi:annexin [Niveomyces insectorum RCEF 264]|uniref:Annexin n=1 Tax=Niveomyces insectorum RCEF 264 TaxID=1081102 RepID=A0A162J951_9HYPO|nr:annexin [Niveomyces insectorum RCEF 264]